jgi:RNA polymerase sigma-70 factor (ECF subfamily)
VNESTGGRSKGFDCRDHDESKHTPMTNPFASLFAPTDEQAMWRVQTQDDAAAFAQLVRRWETPIQRLCVRMTGDVQRGEDLAQETFARLFAKRKEYQPTGKVSTYLWRIALNLCHDELRRRTRRGETSLDAEPEGQGISALPAYDAAPDAQLESAERFEMVRAALARLPEGFRSVVVLRHYENLKFREIADVLDIPEGTVKSRMAEALTQLTRYLKPAMDGAPMTKPPRRMDERMLI